MNIHHIDLPPGLEYLEPVFADLLAVEPDSIDEDFDTTTLLATLRARISGLSLGDASRKLAQDRTALSRWLRDRPEHPAHFVVAFMEPTELAEFVSQAAVRPTKKQGKPSASRLRKPLLEVPNGFRAIYQRGSLALLSDAVGVIVTPMTEQDMLTMRNSIAAMPGSAGSEITLGNASGFKHVFARRRFYFLSVQKQPFQVVVDAGGRPYDEERIETLIASITF